MNEKEIETEEIKAETEPQADIQRIEKESHKYTHVFEEIFEYEGKQYDSLHFDWGKLKGRDGLAIERELKDLGIYFFIPSTSSEYLIRMAVRASEEKIGVDVLEAIPIRDYNKIIGAAKGFLSNKESLWKM